MKLKLSPLISTIFFALFAPVASAQQANCTGWVSDNRTVKHVFWESVEVEVISTCIKAGADVNVRTDNVVGFTPLHLAAAKNDNPAVITALIEAGAGVNARTEDGATPLHAAALQNDNPAVITALIEAGADVNARTEDGETPLHAAAASTDSPAVITALMKARANGATTNDDGETPFDLAKENDAIKGSDAYWALNDARFK